MKGGDSGTWTWAQQIIVEVCSKQSRDEIAGVPPVLS